MPFAIRVFKTNSQDIIDLGDWKSPLFGDDKDYEGNVFNLIEIKEGEVVSTFTIRNTLLRSENGMFCYRQKLYPKKAFFNCNLKGTLIGNDPEIVTIIKGNDRIENFKIAFIPKNDNHYIQIDGFCHRCTSVIYKKNDILINVHDIGTSEQEFLHEYIL